MNYKDILTLIRINDRKGYEILYTTYADKFYGYAFSKWGCSEDQALDVVYKTLETLIAKIFNYEFESQAQFEGFLYKVLINFLRQEFRRKRIEEKNIVFVNMTELELESVGNTNITDVNDFFSSDSFANYYKEDKSVNANLTFMQQALELLQPFDKELLLLKAQNFTYDEIAKMMGVDNNQLKVKHHRAKARLVKLLEQKINSK